MTTTETQHEAESTALVLCGGGAHGALEVGFVQALEELGIRYDHVFGSSIGALNGAFLAGGASPAGLADLWRAARLRRFARPNWRWLTHPRTQPGLLSLAALRRFLETHLPVRRFEDLPIPLSIVTTDLLTGRACYWEGEGDLVDPLLASMSVPGIFPPVILDGHPHIDGGVADNAPLTRAADRGYRRALLIECACAAPCSRPPAGLIGVVGRAFEIALARKHRAELKLEAIRIETFRVVPRLTSEP
jgi:NTE family protein